MGQDLSDVMAAGANCGKEGVADGVFQRASRQAAVGFHVADFCFDGAAAAEICDQLWCEAAPRAADQDAGPVFIVTAIAAVDDGELGALVGEDFDLLQGFLQGVAIVGVARKAAHADHEAFVQRGGDTDLATEFIAHLGLAL